MADFTLHHQPQKSTNRYQILIHSVGPCGLLLGRAAIRFVLQKKRKRRIAMLGSIHLLNLGTKALAFVMIIL